MGTKESESQFSLKRRELKEKAAFPPAVSLSLGIVILLSIFLDRTHSDIDIPGAVVAGILFALNAGIITTWLRSGFAAGITASALSILICILAVLVTTKNYLIREIYLYFATSLFCYGLTEREKKLKKYQESTLDEIQQKHNTLDSEYSRNKLKSEALRNRIERYMMLREVAESLTSSLEFDRTVELVVRKALEVIGREETTSLLYLADVETQSLALRASSETRVKSKKGDEFDRWVLKRGQVLLVEDVEKDFRFRLREEEKRERRVGSLISAPLISGERTIGVLRVDSLEADSFFTDDLRLLNVLATLSAVSIQNAQFYERVEELAITDGLTGLYVHRYFRQRLEEELTRAMRGKSCVSLLMIDIDNFKNYNDRYGHATGDIVLRKVSAALSAKAEDGNIVARYGGEEFGIVLPRFAKESAKKLAETIRSAIEKTTISARNEKTNITISIGVATFPDDAVAREDLIREADEALLKAKREGKNRVCTAPGTASHG